MICRSKHILFSAARNPAGFTFPEVIAALMILAATSAGVLVIIDRCMASSADLALRMQAFEVARDNMERLLALEKVEETAEYGESELYPDITWNTVVQPFYEPVSSRMWVQAICSAEYFDTQGEIRAVELTCWLASLTKEQIKELVEEKLKQKQMLAEADQLVETALEAADYVGADEQTIQEWVEKGMPRTEDGEFIKLYLDLYSEYDGDPPPEAMQEVAETYAELTGSAMIRGLTGPTPGGPLLGQPGGPSSGTTAGTAPGPGRGRGTAPPLRKIWGDLGLPPDRFDEFFPEESGN